MGRQWLGSGGLAPIRALLLSFGPLIYIHRGQARLPGLTAVGKLEGEHAALMQVQLVLVRLGVVQHLHIAALHAHSQPLPSGAVTQREDLQERDQMSSASMPSRSHHSFPITSPPALCKAKPSSPLSPIAQGYGMSVFIPIFIGERLRLREVADSR